MIQIYIFLCKGDIEDQIENDALHIIVRLMILNSNAIPKNPLVTSFSQNIKIFKSGQMTKRKGNKKLKKKFSTS